MSRMQTRRTLVLLALLPQFLVLGLGRGIVLCVGDGGHARIEVAASACCTISPAQAQHGDDEHCDDAGDCEACTDMTVVVSARFSPATERSDSPASVPAAGPPGADETDEPRGRRDLATFAGSRGSPEPAHLLALQSVRLRC
jgi:hypothetical protein